MSAPTDPALLAQYTSGQISYAEYQLQMKRRSQDIETAGAAQQLMIYLQGSQNQGRTACNDPEAAAQLVASELALQAESRRRLEEQWARQEAERQRKEKEAAYIREQQRAIDQARLSVSTCSPDGAACLDDIAAKQAQLERDKQAIADAQNDRIKVEYARTAVEDAPMDWESLPAEEQGLYIALEMNNRRLALAEALGDTIEDPNPAFVNTPIVPGAPIPDYSAGYTPAPVPSLVDIIEDGPPDHPIIDVNLWPAVSEGGEIPQDAVYGGSGGSSACGGSGCDDLYDDDYYGVLPSSQGGGTTKTPSGTSTDDVTPSDSGDGVTVKGGDSGNWLDSLAGLLRMLDDGFYIDVGPGLSDVSVGRHLTGSQTNWIPILLVAAGVVLLIMLMK